jgi:formate hydrogenlyase subunit 4
MKQHWLVRPGTIRLLRVIVLFVLALTVLASLFTAVHARFRIDGSFAFNAWYGFLSCIGMVLVAKLLGRLLHRKDSYYDRD